MSQSKFDVVVVGNIGVDTNVYLYGDSIDFGVEANFTENIDCVWQAGGYASRGYAQLGKRAAFIGHVGDDHNGRLVRSELARDGVDTTALFVDPMGTSRSVNFVYRDGRRKNFYDGKSHMHLQPDLDLCRAVLCDAKFAHFNIPNWARRLLPIAQDLGLKIACDVQDVVSIDDEYRQDFIAAADFLFFSSVNYIDPALLMEGLMAANPHQIVVAGLGAQGCALGTRGGIQTFDAVKMDLPVIDTNGAGDGLAVGFLTSYLLDGYSLSDSVRRGQITACYTCTRKGCSSTLITRDQLERYFQG
jgi:sugar/nucleoside kinase (ribokinase family)